MPSLQVKKNKGKSYQVSTCHRKLQTKELESSVHKRQHQKKKKKIERALAVCSQNCPKAVEGFRTFNGTDIRHPSHVSSELVVLFPEHTEDSNFVR